MQRKISIIGLGYVGIATATAFGQLDKVIAFDIDPERIKELQDGHDVNHEISDQELANSKIEFTTNPEDLRKANFHIISVPTPLDEHNNPDLSHLIDATEMLGKQLKEGDIVVYESTVYPGATEDKCIPILEEISKLKCGENFSVGFSPERINPGDDIHTLETIKKIIASIDEQTLEIMATVYSKVVKAGIYRAPSIRVAEVAKLIENTQRDINIGFMNEMAVLLHGLGIDTFEVINAMKTKWNFLPFTPGFVGGHCIGVNPHYLLYKAREIDYPLAIVASSRNVNECLINFIARNTALLLKKINIHLSKARIGILGLTYKKNCSDVRDTKVMDLVDILKSHGAKIFINDPLANRPLAKKEYGILLKDLSELSQLDLIIIAVSHREYIDMDKSILKKILNRPGVIMDIKHILNEVDFQQEEIIFWRL